ncbi:MAG: penicillin-binding protein 2 [Clostridiales bacterium]|nr:penicillin-binding protein 2 [Clostridiales bacterium]
MRAFFKDRFNIMALTFIIIASIITAQLVGLQIIHGQENDINSQRRLLSDRRIPAPRGNIKDRNGVPIAVNRQGFLVQVVNTRMETEELNKMLLKLVKIFEKNGDNYFRSLNKYLTFNPIEFGEDINKSDTKVQKWISEMAVKPKDIEQMSTPKEVFDYLRQKFSINPSYSDEEAYKIMTFRYEMLIRGFSALGPLQLAKDVSKETVAQIEEMHSDFPGVSTDIEPIRSYVDAKLAAHVIGYVGNIDADTYNKKKNDGYSMTDIYGKAGVELSAEADLKGKPGIKRVEMDAWGRTTEELGENAAVPGHDVILTIDTRLQKVAMESLERTINTIRTTNVDYKKNFGDANAGAVIAMDVKSGEVLAMASYPSYDPSVFLEGREQKDAQALISQWMNDPGKPMLNRTTQEIYAPGSTYKPITAIAALQEGVVAPWTTVFDPGKVNIGGRDFFCLEYRDYGWSHGALKLKDALANSCNIYFHKVGYDTGIDNIDKWAKAFGLGVKTGIDVGSEVAGIRSSKPFKEELVNAIKKKDPRNLESANWFPADTAQSAIGQMYNAFTPIQIADYVSTLANGGKKFKPHLIKKVLKYDGSTVRETVPEYEQLDMRTENIQAVRDGMIAVTNATDGTAVGMFDDLVYNGIRIQVAGKTGTAETGYTGKSSNGLFVAYAPADDPKIAVTVVIERGAWGSNAAPVAKDILKEYFNMNNINTVDDKLKSDEFNLIP